MIAINVANKILNILMGNKYLHSRFNNWSIRSRGNVHRNHMMTKIKKKVLPMNQILDGI